MRRPFLLFTVAVCHGCSCASAQPWTPPRLSNGQPDLQGIWENNSATPLEWPAQLADKPLLSETELADLETRAAQIFGPDADAVFGDALYIAGSPFRPASGGPFASVLKWDGAS